MTLSGSNRPIPNPKTVQYDAVYAQVNKPKPPTVDRSNKPDRPPIDRSNKPKPKVDIREQVPPVDKNAKPPQGPHPKPKIPDHLRNGTGHNSRIENENPYDLPQDALNNIKSKKEENPLGTVTRKMQQDGLKNPPRSQVNTHNAAAAIVRSMSKSQDGTPPPPVCRDLKPNRVGLGGR